MTLADFVNAKVGLLIEKVQEQSQRAGENTSDKCIHDLRVAIRRLSENLRVFEDLFPRDAAKAVRKDLKSAMKLAGETRDHDIARKLMAKARMAVAKELNVRREASATQLATLLVKWNQSTQYDDWREQLQCQRS